MGSKWIFPKMLMEKRTACGGNLPNLYSLNLRLQAAQVSCCPVKWTYMSIRPFLLQIRKHFGVSLIFLTTDTQVHCEFNRNQNVHEAKPIGLLESSTCHIN